MTREFLKNASYFDFSQKVSKIHGRHNYDVCINRVDKYVNVGGSGAMRNAGITTPTFISVIQGLKLCYASFTYKKDLLTLLADLEKYGYQIRWI